MKPKCLIVCVGYDDLLAVTLKHNAHFMDRICVVTSLTDTRTVDVVSGYENAETFKTDAFTRHGARFNKGLAVEEALSHIGREGWILILDADIVLPASFSLGELNPELLYGAHRVVLNNPNSFNAGFEWKSMRADKEQEIAGFFQLFNCSSLRLRTTPWYDPTFCHAGGCDAYFHSLWPKHEQVRLNIKTLHLGPRDQNWFGRVSHRIDGLENESPEDSGQLMERLRISNEWKKIHGVSRARMKDRVSIPGFKSLFKWFNSNPDTDTIKDSAE